MKSHVQTIGYCEVIKNLSEALFYFKESFEGCMTAGDDDLYQILNRKYFELVRFNGEIIDIVAERNKENMGIV